MSENKCWADFDSDDDREYLEGASAALANPKVKCRPGGTDTSVVNLHVGIPARDVNVIPSSGPTNGHARTKPETRKSSDTRIEPQTWRASAHNSSPKQPTTHGWRSSNTGATKEQHQVQQNPCVVQESWGAVTSGMNGLSLGQHPNQPLVTNTQNPRSGQRPGPVFVNDTPTTSPRICAPALLPGPWTTYGQIPSPHRTEGQPGQVHGWAANFSNSPRHAMQHSSRSSSPRVALNVSPRQSTPLLGPSPLIQSEEHSTPSPRVLIVGNACASPRSEKNFELDALYDMVPRPLAMTLRQQTPSLLRNVVTLLLAQPYGLTWQELCVNYSSRYRETLICPVTSSGATMSPNSILADCCHRHEGLLLQDIPGKFRVRPDLLQCTTRPAVRKALLRLQDEALKKLCVKCPELTEPSAANDGRCPRCAAVDNKVISVNPNPSSMNSSPSRLSQPLSQSLSQPLSTSQPLPQPQSFPQPLSQAPNARAPLMPSDFRDLTGGDLPHQILAVLPLAGLPFLQLPKVFRQKHGVALKDQFKGKLAEFLETMAGYDLIVIENKHGPLERWTVRPFVRGASQEIANSRRREPKPQPMVPSTALGDFHV